MTLKAKLGVALAIVIVAALAFYPWGPPPEPARERPADSDSSAVGPARPPAAPEAAEAPAAAPPVEAVAHPLHGRVLDEISGAPIAGAVVSVLAADGYRSEVQSLASVTTGGDGAYRFPALSGNLPGMVVRAEAGGYVPFESPRNDGFTRRSSRQDIHLLPGIVISGEVVFADGSGAGSGVAYLLPRLHASASSSSPQGLSAARYFNLESVPLRIDRHGRFETAVIRGPLGFEVTGGRFAPAFSEVIEARPGERRHVVIEVDEGVVLHGKVVDPDGEPIAGARVTIMPAIRDRYPDHLFYNHHCMLSAVSDSGGAFVIPHASEQYRSLEVQAVGFVAYESYDDLALSAEPLTVVLERSSWLEGRLVTGDDAVASLELRIGRTTQRLPVAADGAFRSRSLPAGSSSASIVVAGHAPLDVTWDPAPGAIDVGTVALERGHAVAVVVRDPGGDPLEGVAVAASRVGDRRARPVAWDETDAGGRAQLRGLVEGAFAVSATAPGRAAAKLAIAVPDDTDVELTLEPLAELHGTVIDAGNRPVRGADVVVRYPEESDVSVRTPPVRTDARGRFRLREVHPGRAVRIEANAPGHAPGAATSDPLAPAEVRSIGSIVLPGGRTVSGVVVDERGRPLAGAIVSAQRTDIGFVGGFSRDPWAESDAGGSFRIAGLPAGAFLVNAVLDGARSEVAQVSLAEVEQATVELEITRGIGYEATVVDESGAPVAGALVELSTGKRYLGAAHSNASGQVFFPQVPEGEALKMTVHHSSYLDDELRFASLASAAAEVVVRRGAVLVLELEVLGDRALPEYVRVERRRPRMSSSDSHRVVDGAVVLAGLAPGELTVRVLAKGFPLSEPATVAVSESADSAAVISLDGSREPVTIVVTDDRGAAVAWASVRFATAGNSSVFFGHGSTDDAGALSSPQPHCPDAILIVEAPGFVTVRLDELASRIVDSTLEVRLAPADH